MMKVLFFILGVPMMIMSFFQVSETLPYVEEYKVILDGNEVQLTQSQQETLGEQIASLLENSHTVPAFGVVFDEMFKQEIENGMYISMRFPSVFEVNGLPFDELVFKVDSEYQGFNLMRGRKGVFQGRCLYVNLENKNMQNIYDFVNGIQNKDAIIENEIIENQKEAVTINQN